MLKTYRISLSLGRQERKHRNKSSEKETRPSFPVSPVTQSCEPPIGLLDLSAAPSPSTTVPEKPFQPLSLNWSGTRKQHYKDTIEKNLRTLCGAPQCGATPTRALLSPISSLAASIDTTDKGGVSQGFPFCHIPCNILYPTSQPASKTWARIRKQDPHGRLL